LQDLDDIWTYLANEAGAAVATEYVAELVTAIDKLSRVPGMGHRRVDVKTPSYRFWVVKSHIIAYRWDSESLNQGCPCPPRST